MNVTIELHTNEYRGDHDADVVIAYAVREGETVQELAQRLIADPVSATSYIVIRRVEP